MKKVPFWLDTESPVAGDCEIAAAVSKEFWKTVHKGVLFQAGSLRDKGFIVGRKFSCLKYDDVPSLTAELSSGKIDSVINLFEPAEVKLLKKARYVFSGIMEEHDVSGGAPYRTAYVVYRVPKTNKIIVILLAGYRDVSRG